jgi:signal recognition particle subunit SRP54
VFDTLSDRLSATFRTLRGKGRLTDADIDESLREIRIALLEADVSLSVVKDFVAAVRERAKTEELSKALNPAQQIVKIVNDELVGILGGETRHLRFAKKPPTVIMLAGLQGSGKTTLAGKLAVWLKSQGHTPMLVAADLQRPDAVTQLQVIAQQAGVAAYAPQPGNGVGDPIEVARESIQIASHHLHDVVIVDTAGRLQTKTNLMEELKKMRRVIEREMGAPPAETLLVLDGTTGQNAISQAKLFHEAAALTGAIVTKLDSTAKGGVLVAIVDELEVPIKFVGLGETAEDLRPFSPGEFIDALFENAEF